MDELVESILDYIRKPYTDHAIMINGEWGSGKTYFWNNKVKNKIESLRKEAKIEFYDDNYNPETIQKKIKESAAQDPKAPQVQPTEENK